MRRIVLQIALVGFALVGLVASQDDFCRDVSAAEWDQGITPWKFSFGLNDGGGVAPYKWEVINGYWTGTGDYYLNKQTNTAIVGMAFWINQTPLQAGFNVTQKNNLVPGPDFIPTASFTCGTKNTSAIWGPMYPDYRNVDFDVRGRYPNIEVYVHTSVPKETSYIRQILFVKNTGSSAQRFELVADCYTVDYELDISPIENDGRYYTTFPFQEGDMGADNTDPASTVTYSITSLHVRGPNGRDQTTSVEGNYDVYLISPTYHTVLSAGEEMGLMFIISFGMNKTGALKNAAEIDTEPDFIFHDLNADQLSLIRNWGGCEVILGPATTVTITPPSQCSSGLTSDFTVDAKSDRKDFTTGFTHRVIGIQGIEMVPPQSSSTLSVPNDVGTVTHQLWYKECLVTETTFEACATAAPVTQTPASSPSSSNAPQSKTNSASSIGFNPIAVVLTVLACSRMSVKASVVLMTLVLVGLAQGQSSYYSSCSSVATEDLPTSGTPLAAQFGLTDGGGSPPYAYVLTNGWWMTNGDLYLQRSDSNSLLDTMFFWINQVPLQPGLNSTRDPNFIVSTANFTCMSDSSGIWGPAYPDYRESDFGERGRYQNLQVFIHYSIPAETSYIRMILFIKNTGSKAERVRLWGDGYAKAYVTNVSPVDNNGRYFTASSFQAGDFGMDNNVEDTYYKFSWHSRGPKGRDQNSRFYASYVGSYMIQPAYNTLLPAGKEIALMYIVSFGMNTTGALKNAAEIDTEPDFIFHDLNADQLSLIRNWGGCEVILGPATTVTITPPSQCSSGLTSDFTVDATTTRKDLTSGFTHQVIGRGVVVVPSQSSSTLSVPNGLGTVTHQLWYKECLVTEKTFNACPKA